MKKSTWRSIYLAVSYTSNKNPENTKYRLTLKSVEVKFYESKNAALGYAYAFKDCAYVRDEEKGQTVVWAGNPGYYSGVCKVVVIQKNDDKSGYGIDMSKDQVKKLQNLIIEMRNDWMGHKTVKKYPDKSVELSRHAWRTSIPNGYKLLRQGAVIRETDQEYNKPFWGSVSHYNVGNKVKMRSGYTFIDLGGKKTHHKGECDPLIIRKKK